MPPVTLKGAEIRRVEKRALENFAKQWHIAFIFFKGYAVACNDQFKDAYEFLQKSGR